MNAVGTAVTSVACGEKHTILLADDGKMWSVGGNEDGQLGRGGRGPGSFTIYPVSFSGGVKMLQVHFVHPSCLESHHMLVTSYLF